METTEDWNKRRERRIREIVNKDIERLYKLGHKAFKDGDRVKGYNICKLLNDKYGCDIPIKEGKDWGNEPE